MIDQVVAVVRRTADLDAASATPIYRRLGRGLRAAVEEGVVGVGDALPSERDLAEALGVSRVTVRNAVHELVEEGLLEKRRGAGNFVAPRVEQPLSQLTGFTEDINARGMRAGVEWIDRSTGAATPAEALALVLSPGTAVSRLYRVRLADGKPMCLEQATLPKAILPDPELVGGSLYEHLEARGTRPVRALQRLRAELLGEEHARRLHVPAGTACLYIERRSFLSDGRPVEFVRSHYRGDAYDFVAELQV